MRNDRRHVIGFLTSSTIRPWAARQWEGVFEAARDLDVELVSYIGGVLSSERFESQAKFVYDLAAAASLDGVIIWSTALGWMIPRPEMAEFLSRFRPKPMVSLEMSFPGLPCVLMDDYGGMKEVIDHLIEAHGRRRIAFLRGPATHEGFEARFRAYRDSLDEHGIAFDPGIVHLSSDELDGAEGIRAILDRGASLDALAGADDLIVTASLRVLEERGIRVPEDVAVAGFDNIAECQTTSPPLTSAEPPFLAMGRRALEIVIDQIEGRPVPESETLPVRLVTRLSCGCKPVSGREALEALAPSCGSCPGLISDGVANGVADGMDDGEAPLRGLLAGFRGAVLDGDAEGFLATVETSLSSSKPGRDGPLAWLGILPELQRAALEWEASLPREERARAGELMSRAQGLVNDALRREMARSQVSFISRNSIMRMLNEKLVEVYDLPEQMDVIAWHLARLGIPGCNISFFSRPEDPTGEARLVLSFDRQGQRTLPPEGLPFPASLLVPGGELPEPRRTSHLVLGLYYGQACYGFAVFEIAEKEDAMLCEILRWQISSALKFSHDIHQEKAAASQKATMLKELQHRVKNSIGLITSVIRLEAARASSPEARETLADLEARVSSVGNLYETLYDAGEAESIDLAEYLSRVVDSAASLGAESGRISFRRSLEHRAMDMKRAIYLGLIVNELITDCLKHAFPGGRSGRIDVSLALRGGSLVLGISDDGCGFPPGFDPAAGKGFGFEMVSILARQLEGSLSFESGEGGTRTTLRIDDYREEGSP
jgi:two-component sensor histidine kinase/DNA-binding LacI/PurR family transcriptional regulator